MTSLHQPQPFGAGGGSPKGSRTSLCSLRLSAGEAAFISAVAQEPRGLLRWSCESVPPHLPGCALCWESQQVGGRTFAAATTSQTCFGAHATSKRWSSRDCFALVSSCGVIPLCSVRSFPWVILFSSPGDRKNISRGKCLWKNSCYLPPPQTRMKTAFQARKQRC